MEQLFMALSGFTIAIAYYSFIAGTLRGTVEPNRATWIVWFVQDGLMGASAVMARVGPAAVMPVTWGIGAMIMCWLSITRGTREPFNRMEKICLALSGFGILLWATTGVPMLALIASVSAACIGGIPTLIKAWTRPLTEPMMGWLLMVTATVFSAIAIQKWTFESGLLPVAVGSYQVGTLLPLVINALSSPTKVSCSEDL